MSTVLEIATKAYELWKTRELDAVAALFGDNALLAIPGRTKISGDHKGRAAVSSALAQIAQARAGDKHRQEPICSYSSSGGAMFVFDNFVTLAGKTEQYHSVHEWMTRDGKLVAVMLYVHEYDVFERAWA